MKNWCNLHVHTTFSMLDGHGKVDKYAERAAELGMTALAQTDHGNVHGWLDFYEACKKVDIKPILGLEAYFGISRPPVSLSAFAPYLFPSLLFLSP